MGRIRTTRQARALRPYGHERAAQKAFWKVFDLLFGTPGTYREMPEDTRNELLDRYYSLLARKQIAELRLINWKYFKK